MFLSEFAGRRLPGSRATLARIRVLMVKHFTSSLTVVRARAAASGPHLALAASRVRDRLDLLRGDLEPAVARSRAQAVQYKVRLGAAAVRISTRAIAAGPDLKATAARSRAAWAAVDSRLAASTGRARARLAPHAEAALIRVRTPEFRGATVPYLAIGLLSVSAGLMIAATV
jgi:hypothetical protein